MVHWFMILLTVGNDTGVYKPTYKLDWPHCTCLAASRVYQSWYIPWKWWVRQQRMWCLGNVQQLSCSMIDIPYPYTCKMVDLQHCWVDFEFQMSMSQTFQSHKRTGITRPTFRATLVLLAHCALRYLSWCEKGRKKETSGLFSLEWWLHHPILEKTGHGTFKSVCILI